MSVPVPRERADRFTYLGLEIEGSSLVGHYRLDDLEFRERVDFDHVASLEGAATRAVATLWYVIAGLSYYKAGAAREVDFAETALGPRALAFVQAAYLDGLGEYAYRNDLDLTDLTFVGSALGTAHAPPHEPLDRQRVLVPFGGGIDSVVTTESLNPALERALFVVSPASGRFGPLEETAAVTSLEIVRARRTLDPMITAAKDGFFQGHVPVTAMVTLLASVAAVATGRGGVVMSNEHSASVDNVQWRGRGVNHQWSKSFAAEVALGQAVGEQLGEALRVASFLRDRSELWVASVFAQLPQYHHVFRSCNRAFRQDVARRATQWCGECDKCLFINLVLAPFLSRAALRDVFQSEPLADHALASALETLVGLGLDHKPFECVGDPGECASALSIVAARDEWRDVPHLREIASRLAPTPPLNVLLAPLGESRVPAHWLR
ncbi:MAG: hypothetical protein KGL79_09610 [Acidobacteriota bacterium]|nr:hypothetical protein [Acidobacteriota bacterium]